MTENYPAHLETIVELGSEVRMRLRPVRPEDETSMQDFFYSLSDRTIYSRFFLHLKFFPLSFLRKFTHIDYSTHMTIVGEAEGVDQTLIAVGYYAVNSGTNMGEVALIVRDDWQNRGAGTLMLNYLIKVARAQGLDGFTAEVLKNNARMIKLLHHAGFSVSPGAGRSSMSAQLRFSKDKHKVDSGAS